MSMRETFFRHIGRYPLNDQELAGYINSGNPELFKKSTFAALEEKMAKMRDEHETKLRELQNAQRKQLETIKNNEATIQEILGNQQQTIRELNEQNQKLTKTNQQLLANQEKICAFLVNASRRYNEAMVLVCQQNGIEMNHDEQNLLEDITRELIE